METVGEEAIRGEYRLKFVDQIYWAFSLPGRIIRIIAVSIALFVATVAAMEFSSGEGSILFMLFPIAKFAAFVSIFFPALVVIQNAIYFIRLKGDQKNLAWEIDRARFTLIDGTGSSVQFPWSQLRFIGRRRTGVVLSFIPMGYRWIAKRAFSDDAWVKIMSWAKESGVSIR